MSEKEIHVANDFYPRPSGRYEKDGKYTGEAFRENFLMPALDSIQNYDKNSTLIVDFSDVTMAGSSFLEEAFGGLVRSRKYTKDFLKRVLVIKSPKRPIIGERIKLYITEA